MEKNFKGMHGKKQWMKNKRETLHFKMLRNIWNRSTMHGDRIVESGVKED